ncbi:unnamed protein product [Rotaria socialis]|uniref:Uncharacterized protein n=1 Tax=Rotaria socialis TaxID=392032 RepID=A0A820MU95_9BILA|nr:unnamed protein product [Rotaria socialis]CAF3630096.1 unnamed protein product [Rotaria socialis]CAF4359804.1 unnamed protein product [Rotaria socialis]CAF4377697.1 unnamed protein product [Rotaria socialis]CAF4632026.1 unnamed protein product [Rotaria socialis]
MARSNQVKPAVTTVSGSYTSNVFEAPITLDDETANIYLTHLRKYVSRKFCYHSDAAAEAKIIKVIGRVAFKIDIWTLIEKRWIKSISSPYKNEETPGKTVENLFDEEIYNLKADTTVVQGNQIGHIILPETQKKISCTACRGEGKKPCGSCKGVVDQNLKPCSKCNSSGYLSCSKCLTSGNILQRNEMHCKRYTLHSLTYPKNIFLPDECIEKSNGKIEFFEDDVLYEGESFWSNFDSLESRIKEDSPHDFRNVIEKQFKDNHLSKMNKSTRIRRMKCKIQRLDLFEIDYQAGDYTNKANTQKGPNVFTFLLYGHDIKNKPEIFENDYPLNSCGCFGHGCACRSKCCSIS